MMPISPIHWTKLLTLSFLGLSTDLLEVVDYSDSLKSSILPIPLGNYNILNR